MKAIVVSTFEGGYQPLNAICAFTALENAQVDVGFIDTYVEGIDLDRICSADLVCISAPLFDSLNAGVELSKRIRIERPDSKIAFFGQYATINARRLTGTYSDYTISGEWERPLVSLAKRLRGESVENTVGIFDREIFQSAGACETSFTRDHFVRPRRQVAPPLKKYPQPQLNKLLGEDKIVAGIETTRGCHHKCTYCSVYAAYDGKVLVIPKDILLEDVRSLVVAGMTHLTFTDADFFNTKKHGMDVLRAIHDQFPAITFDLTTRVDHILENEELLPEMHSLGVRVITSALEFPKQEVLDQVFKEMTVAMMEDAIAAVQRSGIRLNPTFITFNPWTTISDMFLLEDFINKNNIEEYVDPIQYETRLHLYKGSPLLNNRTIQNLHLEEKEFSYDWKHPDPKVDELFLDRLTPVEDGVFKRCCLKC